MPPPLIQSPPPGVNLGMRSKLAVGVYVHSFQNLDLLTQGWYALRCFVRRARDQESGLMDEVIEVPVPVESAAERVPADSSLDWIAIRAPPLTIKERRRREARQRYKMNRNSKAKGCLERAAADAEYSSDSSDDEDEPSYTTRALKIQWACEKFCVEHFAQFILPVNLNALKDDDDAGDAGYSSDSSSDEEFKDEDAAADDVDVVFELLHVKTSPEDDKDAMPTRADLAKKVVATQRVRIAGTATGVHEYFPVHFDERHLTLCDVTVHAHLLEHDPVQSEDSVTFDTHRRYDARAVRTFARAFHRGVDVGNRVHTLEEALADAHFTYVAPLVASAHAARRCRRLAPDANGRGTKQKPGGLSPRHSWRANGPFAADAEERIESEADEFLAHPNDGYDHLLEDREPKTPLRVRMRSPANGAGVRWAGPPPWSIPRMTRWRFRRRGGGSWTPTSPASASAPWTTPASGRPPRSRG